MKYEKQFIGVLTQVPSIDGRKLFIRNPQGTVSVFILDKESEITLSEEFYNNATVTITIQCDDNQKLDPHSPLIKGIK